MIPFPLYSAYFMSTDVPGLPSTLSVAANVTEPTLSSESDLSRKSNLSTGFLYLDKSIFKNA